ncbi:TIGR01777 family oxidoreductase [uncultured Lutibacter sp.]|uniref:TIGR01777 family oxidoreductase n=1 Tax=uncultured Lutibacter sp. TaxID=437739 RepID=UPI00260C4913|nr:TIGR01777 family oxidoreductase [uncultured Lutibacter sp.]
MSTILITGGTGLVGKHLSIMLSKKGYNVTVLSRNQTTKPNCYYWNLETNYIDAKAVIEADYIIHLAGAGIADKRWTNERKIELIDSRVKSTNLLFRKIKELNPNLKAFIAASGIGYYGATTSTKIYEENDESGADFLSEICKLWENASNQFKTLNIRTVILRTGVVFSEKGGAFEKISKPFKLGVGAALGSGKQFIPWIHLEDLCNMYAEVIENTEINGVYNAVAPEHITNKTLSKQIAKVLKKPFWLPNIPSFFLKLFLGKMTIILLEGSRVSSRKIVATGFKFNYTTLTKALHNLLK